MSKIKDTIEQIVSCDYCYGVGWEYYGNDEDWNIDPCVCNLYSIPADEIMDYHQLFKTKENA